MKYPSSGEILESIDKETLLREDKNASNIVFSDIFNHIYHEIVKVCLIPGVFPRWPTNEEVRQFGYHQKNFE